MRTMLRLIILAVPLTLGGTAAAQVPVGDSVIGSGTVELGGGFEVDARSGPSGENPLGQLTVRVPSGDVFFSGDVRCLNVIGDIAVMKVFTSQFGLLDVTVRDISGSPPSRDVIEVNFATGSATQCSSPVLALATFTVETGDIVIIDAPPLPTATAQCKNGGWRTYGVFKNQGDCVSFVATGGKSIT
jgi:hypothetical protein